MDGIKTVRGGQRIVKPLSTMGAYLFHWTVAATKGDVRQAVMLCEILRVFEPTTIKLKGGGVGQRPIARHFVDGVRMWRRSISKLAKDTHMTRDQARTALKGIAKLGLIRYWPKAHTMRPGTFHLRKAFLGWAQTDLNSRWAIIPAEINLAPDNFQPYRDHDDGYSQSTPGVLDGWAESSTRWVATCRKRIRMNIAYEETNLQMRLGGHNRQIAKFLVEIHRNYVGQHGGESLVPQPDLPELPRVPATPVPWTVIDECQGNHAAAYVLCQLRWRWAKHRRFAWHDRVPYLPWMVASMARDLYLNRLALDRTLKKLVALGKIKIGYYRIGWKSTRGKEIQHIHLL